MTPDEQRAANEMVAREMGWPHSFSRTGYLFGQPLDEHGNVIPLPDIFANDDAGAAARERAEEWLIRKDWSLSYWVHPDRLGGNVIVNVHGPQHKHKLCVGGATLAEARALALAAAFRALKEGE